MSDERTAVVLAHAQRSSELMEASVDSNAPAGYRSFEGLPVVGNDGSVLVAAVTDVGRSIQVLCSTGRHKVIASARDGWSQLGSFPDRNAAGDVVFVGCSNSHLDGNGRGASEVRCHGGVFRWRRGVVERVVMGARFEHFRGALIDDRGGTVFFASEHGRALAIYRVVDADLDPLRIVGVGDALGGTSIVDFALNPVSIAADGRIAIRLRLADGRELIAVC